MFSPIFRVFPAVAALLLAPVAVLRAEPPIIAKARAYLGSEEALNGVTSVHYTGTLFAVDPADPAKSSTMAIDIVFKAPDQQRTIRTTDSLVDVIALDGFDGWHRVQDVKDSKRHRLQVLDPDQIRRQRAIVQENVGFYRGLDKAGGKVLDLGATTLAGVACRKIAFIHAADLIFFRYFDESSGRLLLSETESGSSIREQGEIRVNGVRFAKRIINTSRTADGKEHTVIIVFDTITLNEAFPASTFANPLYSGK